MGLFSFLQGKSATDNERAPDPVQAARARARRRLIGAAVLLGAGVIGFPLLFETQPRPIPVDIPIEIPRKEAAPSLPLPPPRSASAAPATARVSGGVVNERSADAARAPSAASASSPRGDAPARADAAPRVEAPPASAPGSNKPVAKTESAKVDAAKAEPAKAEPARAQAQPKAEPATKPAARADDGVRARALLEGQGGASAPSGEAKSATVVAAAEPNKPEAGGRFVVQVGAYGEASSARDMRQRVDKLGLKTYTQVVQVDGARRIRVRVGPFGAREDAEKAAGTLRAAGLPAAVMTL